MDFYCHRARLVIEVDGEIHARQVDYDAERDAVIATHGLRILRLANDDVLDHRDTVLRQISALCQTPAPEGLLTSPLPLAPQGEGAGG